MAKQISLKQLQKIVAKEKKKVGTVEERERLEKELRELRAGKSTKLLKRLGRGFVVLTKKGAVATGEGIKKVSKFAEERGAGRFFDTDVSAGGKGEFFDTEYSGRPSTVRRVRVVRRKPSRRRIQVVRRIANSKTRQVFVPGLGTVTQKVGRKAVKRTIKRKPKRRTVRRERTENGGFFGGLQQVDF